jgi:hypothetical protein
MRKQNLMALLVFGIIENTTFDSLSFSKLNKERPL